VFSGTLKRFAYRGRNNAVDRFSHFGTLIHHQNVIFRLWRSVNAYELFSADLLQNARMAILGQKAAYPFHLLIARKLAPIAKLIRPGSACSG
jgi:hypothetical protein